MDTVKAAFILECKTLSKSRKTEEYKNQVKFIHEILDLDWSKYKGWPIVEIQRDWEALCRKDEKRSQR